LGCGATVARATAGAQAAAPATPAVGRGKKINPSYLLRHWEWIDNWYSSNRSYVLCSILWPLDAYMPVPSWFGCPCPDSIQPGNKCNKHSTTTNP